jgi:hypothetical protein
MHMMWASVSNTFKPLELINPMFSGTVMLHKGPVQLASSQMLGGRP